MGTVKIFLRNFEGMHKNIFPLNYINFLKITNKIPVEEVSVLLGYILQLIAASRLG